MSSLSKKYLSIISKILEKISDEEEKKITDCAKIIRDSYKKGGQLYIFGTGHSRLLGEEAFHRAGGFAAACPIRDDNLTFKKGAKKQLHWKGLQMLPEKLLINITLQKKIF